MMIPSKIENPIIDQLEIALKWLNYDASHTEDDLDCDDDLHEAEFLPNEQYSYNYETGTWEDRDDS